MFELIFAPSKTDFLSTQDLLLSPEEFAKQHDLHYITLDLLNVERKKRKENFVFIHDGKEITCKKKIKIFNSYKVPPSWEKVRLTANTKAHLLAIGRDLKNRRQYIYHPKWHELKGVTKFVKLYGLSKKLPILRAQVDKDLKLNEFPKNKVIAIVIMLLEESHIRVGNRFYTNKNNTYGLCTLRSRHLNFEKDKLIIEFKGKKGKTNNVTLENKKLLRLINRCEEIPGWELFKYFDKDGNKRNITSSDVNNYIHDTCGDIFSAKDFRTWSASLICFTTLKERIKKGKKDKTKNIIKSIDKAAKALNNTRATCRKYYVHPYIIESYEKNNLNQYFEKAEKYKNDQKGLLQPNEKALQDLLKTYKPKISK